MSPCIGINQAQGGASVEKSWKIAPANFGNKAFWLIKLTDWRVMAQINWGSVGRWQRTDNTHLSRQT